MQIRNNKLIYQDKPRLKTALEMLRTSMSLEESLSEVVVALIQSSTLLICTLFVTIRAFLFIIKKYYLVMRLR